MVNRRRGTIAWLIGLALVTGGSTCGGGDGSGGSRAVIRVRNPDPRCVALSTVAFPPAFDFVPGPTGRVVALDFAPPTLVPIDVEPVPPEIAADPDVFELPPDSDGDGLEEGDLIPTIPIPDGISVVDTDLAFITTSSYEAVLFFDPSAGRLRRFRVSVPTPPFVQGDNILLPAPGSDRSQTGISTAACVRPEPGATDSRGASMSVALARVGRCDPTVPSYSPNFTSGVAVAAGHLFVSMSNLNEDQGTLDTQYLPGSVLVYDLDLSSDPPQISPNAVVPVLPTSGFNPTHVTAIEVAGREFVLVSISGAIGLITDDPATSDVIERGAVARTAAAIDVIDAQTLEQVGTIPLGLAGLATAPLAVDPSGRVAVVGSQVGRTLLAVDLAGLDALPSRAIDPVVLDTAVIFDAEKPFRIPPLLGGAPPELCPGFTVGFAFNNAGDRLYATEFCDGSLASVGVDLSGSPTTAQLAQRFELLDLQAVVAPIRTDTLGDARAPGAIRVRPGVPGVDFQGPDVFVLVGEPEGALCGIRIESR